MARQTTKLRKERREAAKAEEFIDGAVEAVAPEPEPKAKRTRAPKEYAFTSDDIIKVRDHQAQSWRQVAVVLGLSGPGAARKAYSELTGVPHNQSQPLVKRQAKGTFSGKPSLKPVWDNDTDQDEILQALQGEWHLPTGQGKDYTPGYYDGSTVSLRRTSLGFPFEEEITIARVDKFHYNFKDELEVHAVDRGTGASRIFKVTDITKVS